MNKIIGLKELRENVDSFIAQINKGDSFVVVRKSKPIFKIAPIDFEEINWERVADFTKLNEKGISAREILSKLKTLNA